MSNATIYDVAGAAKVSLATVSRVLNNPEKVKEETREKVLRVIEELGYRPNAIARGLASRKSTTVGVIVSDISRASTAELLDGIIDIANAYKYVIKLFAIHEVSNLENVLRNVIAEQVDGVLFLDNELEKGELDKVIKMLDDNEIPVVLTNVVDTDPNVPSVSIDYEKAGYELTKKLIDDGRKNIYLLSTVRKYTINEYKEKGYVRAMNDANLEPKVFRTSGDITINRPHFEYFFDQNPVDAAIGVRDSIAISFMNVARDRGKNIPDDLVVIGFQNTKYSILSRPALSCVDIPIYDIGAVAMRYLTKLMNNEAVENKKFYLPHRFLKRETTK